MVSQNCLKCGKPHYVRESELPEINCDLCGGRLTVQMVDGKNYYYVCGVCKRKWKLSECVPDWSELFSYSGLAAHGDGGNIT